MYDTSASQGHPQRWVILGVICFAQLTVLLDNTSLVQSGLLLTAGSAADLPHA